MLVAKSVVHYTYNQVPNQSFYRHLTRPKSCKGPCIVKAIQTKYA